MLFNHSQRPHGETDAANDVTANASAEAALRDQLAGAQSQLEAAAEEAAELRDRLTTLEAAEGGRVATQAEVRGFHLFTGMSFTARQLRIRPKPWPWL